VWKSYYSKLFKSLSHVFPYTIIILSPIILRWWVIFIRHISKENLLKAMWMFQLCPKILWKNIYGFLSRDSQGGVPKLPRLKLPQLCRTITLCSNLRLGQGLKQGCSSRRELSNDVSHFTCTHRGQVDSWLFVVGSQTVNLTPDLSFCHNLCCRCPNGWCELIFDIYTLIAFPWNKERPNVRCFDPCNQTLKFRESQRTPKSPFQECESHLHTLSK